MLLTAWGVFSLFVLTVQLDRFLTCTDGQLLWLFSQGWLAAPLTLTCSFVFSCARGTPILAGGIGVARLVAGAVFCFVAVCMGKFLSVLWLVTRLGSMPCRAWSKKTLTYRLLG